MVVVRQVLQVEQQVHCLQLRVLDWFDSDGIKDYSFYGMFNLNCRKNELS